MNTERQDTHIPVAPDHHSSLRLCAALLFVWMSLAFAIPPRSVQRGADEFTEALGQNFLKVADEFILVKQVDEAGHRPKGEVFHTVTEIDFSYSESTGDLVHGGPPVSFFNDNGYIENGLFVTTGGGGGGGNE
jgi:hypothetical protein